MHDNAPKSTKLVRINGYIFFLGKYPFYPTVSNSQQYVTPMVTLLMHDFENANQSLTVCINKSFFPTKNCFLNHDIHTCVYLLKIFAILALCNRLYS